MTILWGLVCLVCGWRCYAHYHRGNTGRMLMFASATGISLAKVFIGVIG